MPTLADVNLMTSWNYQKSWHSSWSFTHLRLAHSETTFPLERGGRSKNEFDNL